MKADHVAASHGGREQAHGGPAELHDAHASLHVSRDQDGLVLVNRAKPVGMRFGMR